MSKKQKSTTLEVRLGNHSIGDLLEPTAAELKEFLEKAARLNNTSRLEFLLQRMEAYAREILRTNLPFGITAELDIDDLWWAERDAGLSGKQQNAVAVLLNAHGIRDFINRFADMPEYPEAKEMAEALALESIHFALAAVRGDFWSRIWPQAERGAQSTHQQSDALRRATSARKQKSDEMKILARSIADNLSRHRSIRGKALDVQKTFKEKYPDTPCPKLRTIQSWLK